MKHFKDPPPIEPSKPPIDDGSPIPVDRDGKPVLIKRALAECPLLGLSGQTRDEFAVAQRYRGRDDPGYLVGLN